MAKISSSPNIRRPKAYVSSLATNHVHLRNPWVTIWLSATFPGFGHIFIGSYIKGFLLIIWEIVINVESKLNLAIMYSFTGRFELAKETLDQRWLLLYVPVFIYALWDSHRSTIDLNKLSVLADRADPPLVPFKMDSVEVNYLDKRNPWVAAFWSALMPGLGHSCTHRLPTGFFVLTWWIVISYKAKLMTAVHLTFTGAFSQAAAVVDPEWLLFMPSLYGFAILDSYAHTVEYNKLFEAEQRQFLTANYHDSDFSMPI